MHRCLEKWQWLALLVAVCSLYGCSRPKGDRVPVFPVRGRVVFHGPKAQYAMIVFHPVDQTSKNHNKPFGQIAEDGSFVLNTYDTGDGAPAGKYVATVIWRIPGPDEEPGKDIFAQTKYASPANSPLKVTIDDRTNELEPFRLD